jgi:PKD repeat protein
MKGKRALSLSLVAMLIVSMAMLGVGLVAAVDTPWLSLEPPLTEYVGTAPGQYLNTKFNVTVEVHNVTDYYGCDFRLSYNDTLLEYTGYNLRGTNAVIGSLPDLALTITDTSITGSVRLSVLFKESYVPRPDSFNGSGVVAWVEFKIIYVPAQGTSPPTYNEVGCDLNFDEVWTFLYNSAPAVITRNPCVNGDYLYKMTNLVPGAPTADFSYSPAVVFVGNTVTLTDQSSPGPSATLTAWKWTIAAGSGTAHLTGSDSTPTTTFVCDSAGDIYVTLNVTNSFGLSDTETKQIMQLETLEAMLDLYTSPNRFCGQVTTETGVGLLEPADALTPDVNVTLFAEVTWGGAPVAHVLVAFEVFDNSSGTPVNVLSRTAETDKDGIAKIWFRVPRPNPVEDIFGNWFAFAKTKIQDTKIEDLMPFKVGYLITITGVDASPGTVIRDVDGLTVVVGLKNIAMMEKHYVLVVTLYDDCDVPIAKEYVDLVAPPEDPWCNSALWDITFSDISIPDYAYVGVGKVYVSVYTDWPMDCGIPYSPEASTIFLIDW